MKEKDHYSLILKETYKLLKALLSVNKIFIKLKKKNIELFSNIYV